MAYLNTLSDLAVASGGSGTEPTVTAAALPEPTPSRAPYFRWREQWCVGIEALDRDRRALASILNHIALRFGDPTRGPAEAANADPIASQRHSHAPSALCYWLDALRERAKEHFAREEALMRAAHYPDLAEHAGEHALMLAEYTVLVRGIAARGEERLRMEDLEALKQWFMGHVLDTDKRLGRYLHQNGIGTLRPRGHATADVADAA